MANGLFNMLGTLAQQAGLGGASGGALDILANSMRNGQGASMGAGALGGILGALLGGGSAKSAAMSGGTAALATMAWSMYQKWSQNQAQAQTAQGGAYAPAGGFTRSAPDQTAIDSRSDPAALILLEALVNAARADGHVDVQEQAAVENLMAQYFPGTDVAGIIGGMLRRPIDLDDLARRVPDPEQRRDIYRLSGMVIVVDNPMERAYLDALAAAFGISSWERAEIDREMQAARA